MIDFSQWSYPFGPNDKEQQQQLKQIICQKDAFISIERDDFENKYTSFFPSNLNSFIYSVAGTQSVENAIRIAQKITNKKHIICFDGSYHGNSLNLLNALFSDENKIESIFIKYPAPYCLRCVEKCDGSSFNCIDAIFDNIDVDNNIAGLLVDPSFGNVVLNMGTAYFTKLKQECSKRNILLIFDEIRTGFSRTHHLFAFEELNVIPDILCISKAIACGVPLALTLYDGLKISYGELFNNNYHVESTFAGQKIALEMALYTINRLNSQIENKQFPEIDYFFERLSSLKDKTCVLDIRHFGMIFAIEFVNPKNQSYSVARATKFVHDLFSNDIITNGVRHNSIVLLHPYINITRDEIDSAVSTMYNVIK